VLEQQPGFRAKVVDVNREAGRIRAFSVWDTAEDLAASDATIATSAARPHNRRGFQCTGRAL